MHVCPRDRSALAPSAKTAPVPDRGRGDGAVRAHRIDRPSALGLDFGHLLVLLAQYGVATILGVLMAAGQRRWLTLAFQLALPALVVLLAASGRLAL